MTITTNSWRGHFAPLLAKLRADGFAGQADVIVRAGEQGGYISREQVIELTGRADEENLLNFTVSVINRCRKLRETGVLPHYAPDLLHTIYYGEGNDPRPQPAVAFRVPWEAIELVNDQAYALANL